MQEIEAQDMKSCDTDVGGCGQLNSIQHLLEGAPPNVFTVQLAWESQRESSDNIRATLSAIQEVHPLLAHLPIIPICILIENELHDAARICALSRIQQLTTGALNAA